jgi:single-stranded-DNA-specific exonuclease
MTVSAYSNKKPVDPSSWASLQKAAAFIKEACRKNHLIAIWGHDDIDGTASTAIIMDAIRSLGGNVIYFIPPKTSSHYGLDSGIIDKLLEKGVALLITADSGITSLEETEYAVSKGMQVVITDHHELPAQLPKAHSLVNPKITEKVRPSSNLAGAGVALYLSAVLDGGVESDWLSRHQDRTAWAALATISDRVPMTDENRHIVARGLEYFSRSDVVGRLDELLGITNQQGLSPRIVSQTYVGLLSSGLSNGFRHETVELFGGNLDAQYWKDLYTSEQLWLNRREDEVSLKTDLAVKDGAQLKVLIDHDMPWSLVGPVAGGVRERTGHPVVIMGKKDGLIAGECRGYEPFDLVAMLGELKEYFIQYGGHKQAAGFSVIEGREKELKEALKNYGARHSDLILKSKPFEKVDHSFKHLDEAAGLLSQLEEMAPFGPNNQSPVCQFEKLSLPEYGQNGDRYWYKYLSSNQKNPDFKERKCLCTVDITHKKNIYFDIIGIESIG